jgi:hypothetical protein
MQGTKKSASLNLPTLARWRTSNSLPFLEILGFLHEPVKLQFPVFEGLHFGGGRSILGP